MTDLALIERVARAIERTMFADHELPVTGELHERYLETARAAIEETLRPPLAPEAAPPNFFDRKAAVLQKPSRPPIADSFFDGEIEAPEDKDKGWR